MQNSYKLLAIKYLQERSVFYFHVCVCVCVCVRVCVCLPLLNQARLSKMLRLESSQSHLLPLQNA